MQKTELERTVFRHSTTVSIALSGLCFSLKPNTSTVARSNPGLLRPRIKMFEGALPTRRVGIGGLEVLQLGIDGSEQLSHKGEASVDSRGTAATSYLTGILQAPGFISNTRSNLGCGSSKLSKSKMATWEW